MTRIPCFKCNRIHRQDETYPARGKECSKCHKTAHFAVVCRSVTEVTSSGGGGGTLSNFYGVFKGTSISSLLFRKRQVSVLSIAFCCICASYLNYAQIEKECLASLWACDKFSPSFSLRSEGISALDRS